MRSRRVSRNIGIPLSRAGRQRKVVGWATGRAASVMLVSFAGFVGACSSSKSPAGLNAPPSDTGTVGPPTSIVVAPASVSLITGQQQQFSDTVKDAAGHVLSGQTVVWGLTNAQVATVTPTGFLTASTVGSDT